MNIKTVVSLVTVMFLLTIPLLGYGSIITYATNGTQLGSVITVSWDASDVGTQRCENTANCILFIQIGDTSMIVGKLVSGYPAWRGPGDGTVTPDPRMAKYPGTGAITGTAKFTMGLNNKWRNKPLYYCWALYTDLGHPIRNIYCSNTITPTPTTACDVNGGSDISVSFGGIERTDIGTSAGGKSTVQKSLTLSCDDTAIHDFSVQMRSTPASWNGDAIQTSNKDVGVITQWNGATLTNGSSQTLSVRGSTSATLSFTPVHGAGWSTDNIATGSFTASATLVVTQQ